MAGITAQSATATLAAGDTAVDKSVAGFLVNERITLGSTLAGSGYTWSLAAPNTSAPAVSAIDDTTDAAPSFMPDVPGYYVVAVTVDGSTSYVLRIAVAAVAILRTNEAQHFLPLTNAQVSTPQIGVVLYYSTDASKLVVKDSSGVVTALY